MRATRWHGENDVGHILIKEGVYGCYGNCEANRAHGQPARQAGRILIHTPPEFRSTPELNCRFHITVSILRFYCVSDAVSLFFFHDQSPPPSPLCLLRTEMTAGHFAVMDTIRLDYLLRPLCSLPKPRIISRSRTRKFMLNH